MEPNVFYDEIINKLNLMEFAVEDVLSDPSDKEKINELFRSMHTIKSIANLLYFFEIESLTHKAEDLLDEIRHDRVVFSENIGYLFLELKKFLVTLVDEKLDGLDMDEYELKLYETFEKDILRYLPKTILVLDESLELKERIIDIAENFYQFKVVTASNNTDAKKLLKQNNIKLFLIDISCEKVRGDLFLHEVLDKEDYKKIPLILLSEAKDQYLLEEGKKFHAKAWLLKDFSQKHLTTIIEKFLC